ncbi:MAG TPA: hypothetical protein VK656_06420, partial [Candidatus Acidoferrum sp.]|nr:hypothetical protein [Candidatus Acidoferrum sp.]
MTPTPPPSRLIVVAAVVLAVATTLALGACGHTPSATPTATRAGTPAASRSASAFRLHLLVGTPGSMRPAILMAAADTSSTDLTMTDDSLSGPAAPADTRWASGDRKRGYVLTIGATGRVVSSAAGPTDAGMSWHDVAVHVPAGTAIPGPISVATLSPDGTMIAALSGEADSGAADARLLVIDRGSGATRVVALRAIVDGRPPVWIGDRRVIVPLRDTEDRTALAVVEVATGSIASVLGTSGAIAASG